MSKLTYIEFNGECKHKSAWAAIAGITRNTFQSREKLGWSMTEIMQGYRFDRKMSKNLKIGRKYSKLAMRKSNSAKVKSEYVRSKVKAIFELNQHFSYKRIADILDICHETVNKVLNGEIHKDLTEELAKNRPVCVGRSRKVFCKKCAAQIPKYRGLEHAVFD